MNWTIKFIIITMMLVAPMWLVITFTSGLHFVTGPIILAFAYLAWLTEGPRGVNSTLSREARAIIIVAGAFLGVVHSIGYENAPGPAFLRDFLVQNGWATGAALTFVVAMLTGLTVAIWDMKP